MKLDIELSSTNPSTPCGRSPIEHQSKLLLKGPGSRVRVFLFTLIAALLQWHSLFAGARSPVEQGRLPLGPRVSSGGDSEFGLASCVVNGDGTVRCWGNRETITRQFGSLDNVFVPFSAPVLIAGVTSAVAVAVGDGHACALRSNGTVLCWGENDFGQLGLGGVSPGPGVADVTHNPALVPNLSGVVNITAGSAHTCAALVDGTARCWGANNSGQLGTQTQSDPVSSPVTVKNVSGSGNLAGVVAIAAGGAHTCALRADGTVFCWGLNVAGQVDGHPSNNPQLIPQDIHLSDLSSVVDVATGQFHTCAVLANGTARCWGVNSAGELGTGNTNVTSGPTQVLGLTGAVAIAAGVKHTCALLAGGSAACWGSRSAGQLDGTNVFNSLQPSPIAVPNTTGAVEIAAGPEVSCALRVNDGLRCWGHIGRESDGDPIFSISNTAGITPISGRGVAAGGSHSCARRADGTVACWGANRSGQLGSLLSTDSFTPRGVFLTNASISAVAAGGSHNCSRAGDGSVRCWGNNASGQSGDTAGGTFPTPVTAIDRYVFNSATFNFVATPLAGVTGVANGGNHSCALLGTGAVKCWGLNTAGQLGDGTTNNPQFPAVAVTATVLQSAATAITAGSAHTCAIRIGGGLVTCWGSNSSGQSTVPAGLSGVVAIAAGDSHTCALLTGGTVRCWGSNASGQLGNGTVTNVVGITAGGNHTCALQAGGTVQCWGANGSGQLGNNTTNASTSPVFVKELKLVTCSIAPGICLAEVNLSAMIGLEAGGSHTCALRGDGQPFCWGENGSGQVGDGTAPTDQKVARAVPSFTFNIDPSVTLAAQARVAKVTVLANCPEGEQVEVRVSLVQGNVSGAGITVGACTGGLSRYEVTVPAHGSNGFQAGTAQVSADALVRSRGQIFDSPEWNREVTLAFEQ